MSLERDFVCLLNFQWQLFVPAPMKIGCRILSAFRVFASSVEREKIHFRSDKIFFVRCDERLNWRLTLRRTSHTLGIHAHSHTSCLHIIFVVDCPRIQFSTCLNIRKTLAHCSRYITGLRSDPLTSNENVEQPNFHNKFRAISRDSREEFDPVLKIAAHFTDWTSISDVLTHICSAISIFAIHLHRITRYRMK